MGVDRLIASAFVGFRLVDQCDELKGRRVCVVASVLVGEVSVARTVDQVAASTVQPESSRPLSLAACALLHNGSVMVAASRDLPITATHGSHSVQAAAIDLRWPMAALHSVRSQFSIELLPSSVIASSVAE